MAMLRAIEIVEQIRPYCKTIEIAGSLRRKKTVIGDIEIVCVPKYQVVPDPEDLFATIQENHIVKWIHNPANIETTPIKGGEKYQQFLYHGIQVDLFMTTADEFGRMLALRTGPENYSKKMAARWAQLGYKGVDGQLIHQQTGETAGPFPDEQAFFDFLGMNWIKPEIR